MSRSSNRKNLAVYFLTMLIVAVPTLAFLAPDWSNVTNLGIALRSSARFAFLIYVVVFIARPLQQLVPGPLTVSLLRNRRLIGVSFAAVMTVHLALLCWRFLYVLEEELSLTDRWPGVVTYAFVLLMLITSFDAAARALGPGNWRLLHKAGLYWIGMIFAITLVPDLFSEPTNLLYLTLGMLMACGLALRLAAFVKRKNQSTAAMDSAR
jgi:sulfoxide reductase heme-binding subunit YedZ